MLIARPHLARHCGPSAGSPETPDRSLLAHVFSLVISLALLWCEAPGTDNAQAAAAYVLNASAALCLALLLLCWLAPGSHAMHRQGLGVALRLAGIALTRTSVQALVHEAPAAGAPQNGLAPAWLAATLLLSSGAWAAVLVLAQPIRATLLAPLHLLLARAVVPSTAAVCAAGVLQHPTAAALSDRAYQLLAALTAALPAPLPELLRHGPVGRCRAVLAMAQFICLLLLPALTLLVPCERRQRQREQPPGRAAARQPEPAPGSGSAARSSSSGSLASSAAGTPRLPPGIPQSVCSGNEQLDGGGGGGAAGAGSSSGSGGGGGGVGSSSGGAGGAGSSSGGSAGCAGSAGSAFSLPAAFQAQAQGHQASILLLHGTLACLCGAAFLILLLTPP